MSDLNKNIGYSFCLLLILNCFAFFSTLNIFGLYPRNFKKSRAISLNIFDHFQNLILEKNSPLSSRKVDNKHICPDCLGVTKNRLISDGDDNG